ADREGPLAVIGAALPGDERLAVAFARAPGAARFSRHEDDLLGLAAPLLDGVAASVEGRSVDALGPRELEVAELAARGLGDREIARTLKIGFATVRTHFQRAFAKLGVSSRTELARIALAAIVS